MYNIMWEFQTPVQVVKNKGVIIFLTNVNWKKIVAKVG